MVSPRIIHVNSDLEANFAAKFISDIVTIAFNDQFTAVAVDPSTVFVYSSPQLVEPILQDSTILKLISKPAIKRSKRDGIPPGWLLTSKRISDPPGWLRTSDLTPISDYMAEKSPTPWMLINQMNLEIIEEGNHLAIDRTTHRVTSTQSVDITTAKVALIMMKYKELAESKIEKSSFNAKRDCFLLYLTAYNDLLSRHGQMRFADLIHRVKEYPQLCRIEMNPALALEGLIASGALVTDSQSTLVSIPDQV